MSHLLLRGDALRVPLPDRSVDLVFGSPPYLKARKYLEGGVDLGIARGPEEWVSWMLAVTREALRVSRGAVVWVVAGSTRDRNYIPAPEGLAWEWWRSGGLVEVTTRKRRKPPRGSMYRPVLWHRVGIPGAGGDQWFRADTEYCLCFKREGPLPFANNTAMGHPPKYPVGGDPSHRNPDGRWNNRGENGVVSRKKFKQPELANPGNVIRGTAGRNHMGSHLAHESEAPFPEYVPEWFLKSLCPPGGVVLDPFVGSGTTLKIAEVLGMNSVGVDLRESQCRLASRRVREDLEALAPKPTPQNRVPMKGQMWFRFEEMIA